MKLTQINIFRILLLALLLSNFSLICFPQSNNIHYVLPRHFSVGLNISPSSTLLLNNFDSLPNLSSERKTTMGCTLDLGYFFSNNFGFTIGIGVSPWSTQLSVNTYKKWYKTTDSDGDLYDRRVTGSNIKEVQKITFLSVPITLNIKIPFNERIGFYMNPGVSLFLPVSKAYTCSGIFSYSGYYRAYDLFLTDVIYENFLSNQNNSATGKLDLKALIPAISATAGLEYTLKDYIKISFGASFIKMLTSISKTTIQKDFRLSSDPGNQNSVMNGSKNVAANSLGVSVSVHYLFK